MRKTLISIFLSAAAIVASGTLNAASSLRCEAKLSGAQEPGNVSTEASGKLVANFDAALTRVNVWLRVRGALDANRAHFHCARPGVNGPIAFGLFDPGPLVFDGQLTRGTLTNEDFTGASCEPTTGRPVNNIAALAFAMRDGLVYINVHTPANPGGEIRGQMVCKSRDVNRRDDNSDDESH